MMHSSHRRWLSYMLSSLHHHKTANLLAATQRTFKTNSCLNAVEKPDSIEGQTCPAYMPPTASSPLAWSMLTPGNARINHDVTSKWDKAQTQPTASPCLRMPWMSLLSSMARPNLDQSDAQAARTPLPCCSLQSRQDATQHKSQYTPPAVQLPSTEQSVGLLCTTSTGGSTSGLPGFKAGMQHGSCFSVAWAQQLHARGLKKSAHQLRVGDVVDKDGVLARVVKFVWNHGAARAQGFIVIDTVELVSRKRSSVRMKTDDQMEYVDLVGKTMQVLYIEGEEVHLMDDTTYEQLQVPLELFGDAARWVKPEMEVTVRMNGEEAATVSVPIKQSYKVIEASREAIVKDDGASTKQVVIEGGAAVVVPPHIKQGDTIWVNIDQGTYLGRA